MQQVGRVQEQGAEELLLQGPGPDFGGADAILNFGGAPVAHLEVGKAVLERDHCIVEHPLVGVIDDLGLPERPGIADCAVEIDMLPHHLGHLGEAQIFQDRGAPFGMIPGGSQTGGLAQVMEEGAGGNQGQNQVKPGGDQGVPQVEGDLHHRKAVLPDIGEHAVGFHQLQALGQGGDRQGWGIDHRFIITEAKRGKGKKAKRRKTSGHLNPLT